MSKLVDKDIKYVLPIFAIIFVILIFILSIWMLFHAELIVRNNQFKNLNKDYNWEDEYNKYNCRPFPKCKRWCKKIKGDWDDKCNNFYCMACPECNQSNKKSSKSSLMSLPDTNCRYPDFKYFIDPPESDYKKVVTSYFNNRVILWTSIAIISIVILLTIFIIKIIKMKESPVSKIKHILMIPCLTLFITSFWMLRDIINSKRFIRGGKSYINPTGKTLYNNVLNKSDNDDTKAINKLNNKLYVWSFVITITLICLILYLIKLLKYKTRKQIGYMVARIFISLTLNLCVFYGFTAYMPNFTNITPHAFPYE